MRISKKLMLCRNSVSDSHQFKMYADGKEVQFEAYNINGSNYFKLRDVAYAMNGTSKQFDVRWNSGISILSMTSKGSSKGVVEVIPNQV